MTRGPRAAANDLAEAIRRKLQRATEPQERGPFGMGYEPALIGKSEAEALLALLADRQQDKADLAQLDEVRAETERMVSEGCTAPSPEAFAYLASVRDRHVQQIKALEKKLALCRSRLTTPRVGV